MPPVPRRVLMGAVIASCLSACGSSEPPAAAGNGIADGESRTVEADFHSLKTAPRPAGAIDLLTVSTLPDAVTGGDVLVAVRGVGDNDALTVLRNGVDVTPAFSATANETFRGLVQDLAVGSNTITAVVRGPAGERRAVLDIENHPVSGPVLSGPHQQPFFCQTEAVGLGAPLDSDCRFEPRLQWFARQITQDFVELEDPFSDYPPGTITTQTEDGRSVPWVVRVETRYINRGIARIAVLDDPAARGPDAPFEPLNWNGGVFYVYGESCGVGFTQGRSTPDFVLGGLPDPAAVSADNLLINLAGVSDRLGRGDITVHNTLSAFGNHCNPLISIETTMMTKEHIIERYGDVRRVVGTNGSGAALQQFNAANNAPGLISAGLPTATFADIPSTAMTVADCGLLLRYYANSELEWSQRKQAAVNGHNLLSGNQLNAICQSWADTFLDRLDPTTGCPVPEEMRYNAETNPSGVRCTVQEANVNIFGRDPVTGFARRPLDNTGVQYGLAAFNDGTISFEEFLDLNRNIGGYDIDGQWQVDRMAMDPEVERISYAVGAVIGRGALPETPFIDVAPYLDLIPVANIHEAVRPFTIRARLQPRAGGGITHSIFRGVLTQPDVYPIMDDWLDAIAAADAPFGADRVATVVNAKPSSAEDRCSFGTIGGRLDLPASLLGPLGIEAPLLTQLDLPVEVEIPLRVDVPEDFDNGQGIGPCSTLLPVTATPRMVAGMPLSGDVIRCQRKAVEPQDYAAALTPAQLDAIAEVFPEGVCDYALPAAGDVERSPVWLSFGGRQLLPEPRPLRWRVARGLPAEE